MNCQVKDELVSRLIALNNKLNLLSPDLVHGDEERAEVQQQRENLYIEIKHHRAKDTKANRVQRQNRFGPVLSDWLGKRISAESGLQRVPSRRSVWPFRQRSGGSR